MTCGACGNELEPGQRGRRRRFCSERCAATARKRLQRDRDAADGDAIDVSVSVTHSVRGEAVDPDVAWCFRDDLERYRAMGYR